MEVSVIDPLSVYYRAASGGNDKMGTLYQQLCFCLNFYLDVLHTVAIVADEFQPSLLQLIQQSIDWSYFLVRAALIKYRTLNFHISASFNNIQTADSSGDRTGAVPSAHNS